MTWRGEPGVLSLILGLLVDEPVEHDLARVVGLAVVEANGLGDDDFEHILCSVPAFAARWPACFADLRPRLAEWKTETRGSDAGARNAESRPALGLRVAEGPEGRDIAQ